jgi:hypothetical protein
MIVYRIDPDRQLVTITGVGALTAATQDRIKVDQAFDPGFALLTDYLEALDFTAADLRRMAGNSPFGPRSVRAYAARGDLAFGLLRMYETFGSTASRNDLLRVFRDVDAAMQWIDEVRVGQQAAAN